MNHDPTLGQLLDLALSVTEPPHSAARTRQQRSHLKRYAAWLGCSLKECPRTAYHLSEARRAAIIEAHAADYSASYCRNVAREVSDLLALAMERGWLPTLAEPLPNWRTKGTWDGFEDAYYGRMGGADLSPYALTSFGRRRLARDEPRVGTPKMRQAFRLRTLAPELAHELDTYVASCLDPFDPRTPQPVKKRANTAENHRDTVDELAGYLVHIEGIPAELVTLQDVCDPALLRRFIPWWLRRRGRSTGGLRRFLSVTRTIAEHWFKDVPRAQAIGALYDMPGLPPEQPMDDREAPWLDLEDLDRIAQARHPLNPHRLQDSAYAREVDHYLRHPGERPVRAYRNKPAGTNLHNMAVWAEQSLMLRLLVRRPLRQRNLRELAIRNPRPGEQGWNGAPFANNLVAQKDGSYRLRFEGLGLKIHWRRTKRRQMKVNVWDESWPHSLTQDLEDWLTLWRPRLLKPGREDYPFLFISRWGDPYRGPSLTRLIERNIWIFTQDRPDGPVAINPHRVRSIWWTSMVIAGMDFPTLVRIFGDSVSVAWQNYTDVDKARKVSEWTRELARKIMEGTE